MNRTERYNKIAGKAKNKSSEIIERLGIKANDKILEIGVGGGYYAEVFSDLVGVGGLYYGADTSDEFLENLIKINQKMNNNNIRILKIEDNIIPKPDKKIDLIFTRNVYHHLSNREKYFEKLHEFLEKDGKIVIIDYNERFSLARLFGHYTKSKVIITEMQRANYLLKAEYNILEGQSFFVFERNDN